MTPAQNAELHQRRSRELQDALVRIIAQCEDPKIKRASELRKQVKTEAMYALGYDLPPPLVHVSNDGVGADRHVAEDLRP